MESLLARALESKLKYWLRSFTREQFKLQGRTVQLCNLDINGEVLHASIGLPPSLRVAQARVGRLELKVPSLSNVQVEPVVVEIDTLNLVLVEKSGSEPEVDSDGTQGAATTTKSSSYGFADKIADGMTFQVGTVNLMLETRGGAAGHEGAAWTPPLAALTIRNLVLYTTNECWQVVNLKEARDFSSNKGCIYVFKTLEWDSMSVDLLPHPDMFSDERLTSSKSKQSKRDDDGAKRLFFGGERFLDNISGKAYITMYRTEQNNPLGLEVQVHLPEAVCSALSEPGLRALLRFMTGIYVCLNRGDVGPTSLQSEAEAAGRSMVEVTVDHIFICIKDADFQLELLLQSLQYMRSSVTNGELTKTLARIAVSGVFLRDTFSRPYSTLMQPGMQGACYEPVTIPNFASEKLWPRIYPLDNQTTTVVPLLCMYSIQTVPSPAPPTIASQTVVQCQPLKINLQEKSCLRIASFLVDGVVVERGVVTPATSVDSLHVSLKQLDLAIPMVVGEHGMEIQDNVGNDNFTGVRLHAEDIVFVQSPSLIFKILDLERDPACFTLWQGQPIDASQRRWVMRAMYASVALETGSQSKSELDSSAGLWRCIEMTEPCIEAAMVTEDGLPLVAVPPPGGIVRFGFDCKQLTSNTSVEQLFFVSKMYEHLGTVNESLLKVTRARKKSEAVGVSSQLSVKRLGSFGNIIEMAPSDTAVNLGLGFFQLKFLESLSEQTGQQGTPLVQISGSGISLKVTHRTLGGAIAIASKLCWQDILVECVDTNEFCDSTALLLPSCGSNFGQSAHFQIAHSNQPQLPMQGISKPNSMRPVFWIHNGKCGANSTGDSNQTLSRNLPYFLDVDVVNVIPYRPEDAECHSISIMAKVSGIRLGGGMVFTETLLHRFGVLGPTGGPGDGAKRVLKNLSNGPFANILKPPPRTVDRGLQGEVSVDDSQKWELGSPDEIDINLQLRDWIFALEGSKSESGTKIKNSAEDSFPIGEGCWHSAFQCLRITAQGAHSGRNGDTRNGLPTKHPVQKVIVAMEGLETIKPHSSSFSNGAPDDGLIKRWCEGTHGGLDVEILFGLRDDEADADMGMGEWAVKSVKAGIKKPVEVLATKEEIEYLIETFKLEIESASRIAAGLMQLLQLQGSIGQAAIQQLSSIGSGSLERLITPEKMGRRNSIESCNSVPSYSGHSCEKSSLYLNISRLEQAVSNSRDICAKLSTSFTEAKGSIDEGDVASLVQQLNTMQDLLANLRTAI